MADSLLGRIHGSLAAIAVGDALGFPTHELTFEEIWRRFGGPADRMVDAFDDDIIHLGFRAGQVTDDTILTLVTARAILSSHGNLTARDMVAFLAEWARKNTALWQDGNVFGPSTKESLRRFLEPDYKWVISRARYWAHVGISDGAVMRVAPAGLVSPGMIEDAASLAFEAIAPTHGTDVAISAACAQASAVAEALREGADVLSVVDASLKGARLGETIGKARARVVPAPNIAARIEWVAGLAVRSTDVFEVGQGIQRMFGSHLPAAEALPAAIGLFVAARGDPRMTVIGGATIGGDTDTIASVGGALAGALRGVQAIPTDWLAKVEEVNRLGLPSLAEELYELALSRLRPQPSSVTSNKGSELSDDQPIAK